MNTTGNHQGAARSDSYPPCLHSHGVVNGLILVGLQVTARRSLVPCDCAS